MLKQPYIMPFGRFWQSASMLQFFQHAFASPLRCAQLAPMGQSWVAVHGSYEQ